MAIRKMGLRQLAGVGRGLASPLLLAFAPWVGGVALGQSTTELVSLGATAVPAAGASDQTSISADGRFVAFRSVASNLVPGDTNGVADIFVRDRWTGSVERVSVSSAGVQATGASQEPSISSDGRWVVFSSEANNLVTDAPAAWPWDIFRHDRVTHTTVLVTRAAYSGGASDGDCYRPRVSGNGRYVSFEGGATNLIAGTLTSGIQVFRRDMQTGTTVLVSASISSSAANGFCYNGDVSDDGRYVAFVSLANDLVAGDTNGYPDCFRRDLLTNTTQRMSVSSSGAQGAGNTWQRCAMSSDGRWVAFANGADLTPGPYGLGLQVYLRDASAALTYRVSVSSTNAGANGSSYYLDVSDDGRYVTFDSNATNLDPMDSDTDADVFLRDRVLGTTVLVSRGPDQAGNGTSRYPVISADGALVMFDSTATNLVPQDTNQQKDVFARDLGARNHTSYCAGTASACPCGNGGSGGAGCENSAGTGGALLRAFGPASVSNDGLTLLANGMPQVTSALFFQGTQRASVGLQFGDGLRCVAGTQIRLCQCPVTTGVASIGDGTQGAGAFSIHARGLVPPSGGTRRYQVWYRNTATYCTVSTFNLSNGVEVVWTP